MQSDLIAKIVTIVLLYKACRDQFHPGEQF